MLFRSGAPTFLTTSRCSRPDSTYCGRWWPTTCETVAAFAAIGARFSLPLAPSKHCFCSHISWRNRLLESAIPQWLGRISYSLYLSHALVLKVFVHAFGAWGGVLAIPAALCIGWLIWWGVERPSIKLSRKVGRIAAFQVPSVVTKRLDVL